MNTGYWDDQLTARTGNWAICTSSTTVSFGHHFRYTNNAMALRWCSAVLVLATAHAGGLCRLRRWTSTRSADQPRHGPARPSQEALIY